MIATMLKMFMVLLYQYTVDFGLTGLFSVVSKGCAGSTQQKNLGIAGASFLCATFVFCLIGCMICVAMPTVSEQ